MHRQFAGILGSAAFATTTLRGWAQGAEIDTVLPRAAVCLLVFALLGAALGAAALWTVDEGVAAQLHDALTGREKK